MMTDEKLFDGCCPYTDKPCYIWDCLHCEVEAEERRWMEMLNEDDEEEDDEQTEIH